MSRKKCHPNKMKKAKSNQKKNVSKDQWLAKALETLESSGVDGVKIERLAKALGISRSGFYWHFKNRQELLEHLLEYWTHEYTGVVSNDPDVKKLDPKKRLLAIMDMIREKNLTKYDLAINAWAKADPLARMALKKAVNIRLGFLRAVFAELGFDGDELEMRTRLFVCHHSWEATMFADVHKHKHLQKLRYRLFIQK
jgi:AcrR family transcriptional regulator